MRSSHALLLGLTMLVSTRCHGQAKCPWINETTAHGILGGDVSMAVKLTERGGGVCEFSRSVGKTNLQLSISVYIMTDTLAQFSKYLEQCPPKSALLRAIGNEAVSCSLSKRGQYIERVVSRVRDQAFIVSVSSSAADDPSMTEEMRRKKANLVAEQVAGILF
ncbi:MAG: hypothetical protein WBL50_05020 [Candidatus Acidiferrum sp.]